MHLNKLCEINNIVSNINSQEDAEKSFQNDHFSYIKYYQNKKTDAECVILDDDEHAIKHIIFKGTDSLIDWEYNLDFFPVALTDERPEFKIHRGFYEQWLSLSEWIIKEIETDGLNLKRKKVVISGHSLGGAIAIICAIYLYCISDTLVQNVITIGAPRAVCIDMKEWYDKRLKKRTIRIIDIFDTVPKLPLAGPLLQFSHVDGINFRFYRGNLLPDDNSQIENESVFGSFKHYCNVFSGFFRGVIRFSTHHHLSSYMDNINSFSFFKQYSVYIVRIE